MERQQLKQLIKDFQQQTISDGDLQLLKQFLKDKAADELLASVMDETHAVSHPEKLDKQDSEKLFANILHTFEAQATKQKPKSTQRLGIFLRAAAACLVCAALIGLYIYQPNKNTATIATDRAKSTIIPGGSKAKVVLDDGSILDLESLKSDTVIYLNGYAIRKNADNILSYEIDKELKENTVVYNTIVTPKGGEYHLVLPDGTKIWVNSLSELRYPLNFDPKVRTVTLKGEAYFDVSKLKTKQENIPFIVNTGSQKLEVLGTSFNIRSSANSIETTLVEGAVRLSYKDGKKYLLKPNQQAVFEEQQQNIRIKEVDPFYSIAWKNGSFAFYDDSIYEVMKILSDWYDVKIEYQSPVENVRFTGTVSRYDKIEKVLQAIEMTGSIRFKISGRRIIVMK